MDPEIAGTPKATLNSPAREKEVSIFSRRAAAVPREASQE